MSTSVPEASISGCSTAQDDREEIQHENANDANDANDMSMEEHEDKKEDEEDEEGLRKGGYDVILCGTGLTQSILASALTRAGKSVLHCDNNDFYGDLDSVFSLDALIEWSEQMKKSPLERDRDGSGNDDINDTDPNGITLELTEGRSKIKIHSMSNPLTEQDCLKEGMRVVTNYGEGTVLALPNNFKSHEGETSSTSVDASSVHSLSVQLDKWIMADGKSPIAYFGVDSTVSTSHNLTKYMEQKHGILSISLYEDRSQYETFIQSRQRHFALDLTPALLYANGKAVSGMIDSGVAEYCEFKSIIGLEVLMNENKGKTSRRVKKTRKGRHGDDATCDADRDAGKNDACKSILSRVPCSKRDVFQTKLLSPIEKRQLMKFLQIASDYAVSSSVEATFPGSEEQDTDDKQTNKSNNTSMAADATSMTNGASNTGDLEKEVVTSLNERQLQQGRSLYRPQNKSVATNDLEILKNCMKEEMAFDKYLKEHHKLSDHMVNIIIYAMAMGNGSILTETNIQRDDTAAEGSKNSTRSYSTKDGMLDLCQHIQSLGRFGATAFLVPLYGSGELSQAFCRSAAVHGGTYLLRRGALQVIPQEGNQRVSGILLNGCAYGDGEEVAQKNVRASHVVVPSRMLKGDGKDNDASTDETIRVYRRISILRGKLMTNNENSREEGSLDQRHVIIIPPGNKSIGNDDVIHGIALDASVSVGPRSMDGFETTVLHLTTTAKCEGNNSKIGEKMLEYAIRDLIKCNHETSSTDANQNDIKELFHLSFSHEKYKEDSCDTSSMRGLHLCRDQGLCLTVDSAFYEAERLFDEICPGSSSFLKLSDKMDELVKERRFGQDEEDDETKLLESALDMMKATD